MIKRYELVIYGRYLDDELITIQELGRLVGLHPDKLRRYVILGLLDPVIEKPEPLFEESTVARIYKIERLKNDLGLNLAGCGLVMDLLERIAELEEQLKQSKR